MPRSPTSQSHVRLKSFHLQRFPNTAFSLGEWKRYLDNHWQRVAEMQVRREIQELAIRYATGTVTSSLVGSVYNLLQQHVFLPDDTFDSNIDLITFWDCALTVSTGETRPCRPEDYATSRLPFHYYPEAKSEAWTQALSMTEPEYLPFLQEFAGYCLTPSTAHELALWCWGEPGSAKSTFITGLEAMLGSRCCTLGLADIERSQFALAQIPGKTLAISTEQPSRFVKCSHVLNSLISGESLIWERKFVDPVTVRPMVKLVWAMNELPRIDSSGVGLFRRVVPIPWRKVEKPDPAIKEAVKMSGQAIFNWAYEGLKRLNTRGRFEIPAGLLTERETYRIQNDIPQMFLEEACERVDTFDENGHYNRIQSSILYFNYKQWCLNTSHKPLSSTVFGAEMKRLGIEKASVDGKVWYLGIRLKSIDDHEVEM
jgi:P4 family phage/plasmid primase-like protien